MRGSYDGGKTWFELPDPPSPPEPADLIGKLRYTETNNTLMFSPGWAKARVGVCAEAADEIERLRTALQKIAYPGWGEYPSDEMIVKAVVKIARAALKGKP